MVWRLPASRARAASQVRCQRGSLLGKAGIGLGGVWVGVGTSAADGRTSEGRSAEALVRVASLRNSRRGLGGVDFILCVAAPGGRGIDGAVKFSPSLCAAGCTADK